MFCRKADLYGDSGCEYAKVDLRSPYMTCEHQCVKGLYAELEEVKSKLADAERKLKHYRDAVQPIIRNCRAIVEAADKEEKASNDK